MAEKNIKNIYNADILSAMLAFKKNFKNTSALVIENCRTHKGFLCCAATTAGVDLSRKTQQIRECICELVAPRIRVPIEKPLNAADEDDYI